MDETAGRDVRGSWMGSMEESDESALERALANLGVEPDAGSGAGTGAGAGVDATGDDDLFVSIDDGDGGGGVSRRRFAEWARRLSRATRERSGKRARAATEALKLFYEARKSLPTELGTAILAGVETTAASRGSIGWMLRHRATQAAWDGTERFEAGRMLRTSTRPTLISSSSPSSPSSPSSSPSSFSLSSSSACLSEHSRASEGVLLSRASACSQRPCCEVLMSRAQSDGGVDAEATAAAAGASAFYGARSAGPAMVGRCSWTPG